MRKTMIYMMTAATALTVMTAQPLTAFAANGVYTVAGNLGNCQNKVVIGGNNCLNVEGLLGDWNLNCDQNANLKPNGQNSGMQKPGNVRPGQPGNGSNNQGNTGNQGNIGNQGSAGNQNQGSSNQGSGNQDTTQSSFARQVVNLVNEERAKAGLSELKLNTNAAAAAQIRAQELTSNFSHTRPNGSHFSTALKEAGVSYSSVGENIAYGQTSPEAVMNQWMNSSGHRANILNPDFAEIGVGHYQTASGVHYWTQLFIR